MIVIKGGISRNIDEKNLQIYIDNGYKPVEVEEKNSGKKLAKEKKE